MPFAVPRRWPAFLPIALLLVAPGCSAAGDEALHVAAASSLAPAVDALAEVYRAESGQAAVITYGASVDLAQQLRNGAPYDLFLSADPELAAALANDGLTEAAHEFARGALALVIDPAVSADPAAGLALLTDNRFQAIAIADPGHAPFGRAARQALEAAGLWAALEPKLVYGGSARHALELVQTGNAQAGLIPVSLLPSNLPWLAVPEHLYSPPAYAVAVRTGSPNRAAAATFVELLLSESGGAVLRFHGLIPAEVR